MTLRQAQGDIEVGRIVGVFGVRGELKCDPSNAGRSLFSPGAELRCALGSDSWSVRLRAVRPHKGRLLVRIEGVEDAGAAGSYAGAALYAPRDRIPLGEDEYLDDDLVGCSVEDVHGAPCGAVERVEHYPSSDMLVVGGSMVPLVRAIVLEIDLSRRRIVIDPPEGLLRR
jgi:16S rRNA processing protein RimM